MFVYVCKYLYVYLHIYNMFVYICHLYIDIIIYDIIIYIYMLKAFKLYIVWIYSIYKYEYIYIHGSSLCPHTSPNGVLLGTTPRYLLHLLAVSTSTDGASMLRRSWPLRGRSSSATPRGSGPYPRCVEHPDKVV